MNIRIPIIFLIAAAGALRAAEPMAATVGLAAEAQGQNWAYVLWQPTGGENDAGFGHVAVYKKSGGLDSPAPFTRVSVTKRQSDPAVIETCLRRGALLGDDLQVLSGVLDGGFRNLIDGARSLPLAEKLAVTLEGVDESSDDWRFLLVLARRHPALALALGQAYAGEIGSGLATFEVRKFNVATALDGAVIGRVVVDPNAPVALPAPGRAVAVIDATPTGDLNVHLRWATPDPLRDLALLQFGFDVFRVTKARAQELGWDNVAPASAAMLALCASEPTKARRINRKPFLPDKDLTEEEALNPSDTATFFAIDDNDRFRDGGIKFTDGDEFYYFVAARDLLGRVGVLSPPAWARIYSRMPPLPPRETRVENVVVFNGTERTHHLRVSWAAPESDTGVPIAAYYIYRWTSIDDIARLGRAQHPTEGRPHVNLSGIVPAGAPGARGEFLDDGAVAPPAWADVQSPRPIMAAHQGRTFYYTIRALDAASCGGNISGNSAPAWGVLRDNIGPQEAVTGTVTSTNYLPAVVHDSTQTITDPNARPGEIFVRLRVAASSAEIAWAEIFERVQSGDPVSLGRVQFSGSPPNRIAVLPYRRVRPGESSLRYSCRVGTRGGRVSAVVEIIDEIGLPPAGLGYEVRFNASVTKTTGTHSTHCPRDPDNDAINPILGTVDLPMDARQWRLYLRVDAGPLVLVGQGVVADGGDTVAWTDAAPPAAFARLCYYGQAFDEHGNPGRLFLLACIESGSSLNLPVPMLTPVAGRGNQYSPEMTVRWFCPPAGVERFEVWIAGSPGSAPPVDSGTRLSRDLATHPNRLPDHPDLDFAVFDSARASILSPNGESEFTCDVPVVINQSYTVLVRAVGPGTRDTRIAGEFSKAESFSWLAQQDSLRLDVPWPARALPPVLAGFHEGIGLRYFPASELPELDWSGVGVRVGRALDAFNPDPVFFQDPLPIAGFLVDTHTDPLAYVFRNEQAAANEPQAEAPGSLFPMMLYRTQVPNTMFPIVSGDVSQVSPLMEKIAYQEHQIGGRATAVIWDRYCAMVPPGSIPAADAKRDLFVLDRQPVLAGAKYRYLIVRFGPDHEIERIIPAGEIEIPSPP